MSAQSRRTAWRTSSTTPASRIQSVATSKLRSRAQRGATGGRSLIRLTTSETRSSVYPEADDERADISAM